MDLADADPENITVLDAGKFVRTTRASTCGACRACRAASRGATRTAPSACATIDGLHFCTDPDFAGHGCIGEQHQAGQRRAAASLAVDLVPSLQQLAARPSSTGRQT